MKWMKILDISMSHVIIVVFSRFGDFGFNVSLARTMIFVRVIPCLFLDCYDKNLQLTDKFHPIEHEYRIL